MAIDRRALLGAGLGAGFLAASAGGAQWGDPPTPAAGDPNAPLWPSKEVYRLWPSRQPGQPATLPTPNPTMNGPKNARELWLRGVQHAEIHVFRPARPDGSSLLSMPGGGYGFVSVQNEGLNVAQRFNANGTTVFVLVYRLPGEGWADRHLVALQDAQRAMRFIRSRAADFRIDPARLGVIGFSAGGHLAADLATNYDKEYYTPVDAADRLSARPAFAGLDYPVTNFNIGGPSRSAANMFGPNLSRTIVNERSPVLHVDAETPPSFLVHSLDDPVVPLEHSLEWIAASRGAKVPVEAHLFAAGGHGYGLNLPYDMPGSSWPHIFATWMRKNGG